MAGNVNLAAAQLARLWGLTQHYALGCVLTAPDRLRPPACSRTAHGGVDQRWRGSWRRTSDHLTTSSPRPPCVITPPRPAARLRVSSTPGQAIGERRSLTAVPQRAPSPVPANMDAG